MIPWSTVYIIYVPFKLAQVSIPFNMGYCIGIGIRRLPSFIFRRIVDKRLHKDGIMARALPRNFEYSRPFFFSHVYLSFESLFFS